MKHIYSYVQKFGPQVGVTHMKHINQIYIKYFMRDRLIIFIVLYQLAMVLLTLILTLKLTAYICENVKNVTLLHHIAYSIVRNLIDILPPLN